VHVRRLTVAAILFALAVVVAIWLGSELILQDLSDSFVSRVFAQAKEEVEAVARVAGDPESMGEGDRQEPVRGGADAALDADVVLRPLLPEVFDNQGNPLDPLSRVIPRAAEEGPEGQASRREVAPTGRVPGVISRSGQEWRYFLNGELIGRDAVQYIGINFAGGSRRILLRTIDSREFDRAVLDQPGTQAVRVPVSYLPSSRRVMLSWSADLEGEAVQLEASLDAAVLQEGIAELRARVVPKVLLGGALFLLLLAVAFAWVVRLVGEAQRLEAEAMEQALLAQVGVLAAGLAHEIRNPLSAVHMNLQMLEEDLRESAAAPAGPVAGADGPLGDEGLTAVGSTEHLSLLQATQREIRRLGQLVSDFLAYARPAEPRLESRLLDSVVTDCVGLLRPMAEGAGVRIETDLQGGESPVPLDEALIKQALMNVVLNAIEAVPRPGGWLRVSTRRAATSCLVTVEDDGPGLPGDPEELFRVFHSTKRGGSGLGLPISRAIVERHGGSLVGRNRPDGGAVFDLSIPSGPA
jgi:signal transduction histidine kinase